jgi:hypothetical protein
VTAVPEVPAIGCGVSGEANVARIFSPFFYFKNFTLSSSHLKKKE